MHIGDNHVELHAAAMREHRLSPFRHTTKLLCDKHYRDKVSKRLEDFAKNKLYNRLIFSAEGLSYLKYDDEIDWLVANIPSPVMVVVYLRNREDFLRSYKAGMERYGFHESASPDSFAYTGKDSWLLDYVGRLRPFEERFGGGNVVVVDYDGAVKQEASVIPSFLHVLGLSGHFTVDETRIFLNQSPK